MLTVAIDSSTRAAFRAASLSPSAVMGSAGAAKTSAGAATISEGRQTRCPYLPFFYYFCAARPLFLSAAPERDQRIDLGARPTRAGGHQVGVS